MSEESFRSWVWRVKVRDSAYGDLIRDFRCTKNLPEDFASLAEVEAFVRRQPYACERAVRKCARAWKEFKGSPKRDIPLGVRYAIMQRDGFHCRLCGHGAGHGVLLHVDHIVAIANGGSNEPDNLWTLCRDCNLGKGARDLTPSTSPQAVKLIPAAIEVAPPVSGRGSRVKSAEAKKDLKAELADKVRQFLKKNPKRDKIGAKELVTAVLGKENMECTLVDSRHVGEVMRELQWKRQTIRDTSSGGTVMGWRKSDELLDQEHLESLKLRGLTLTGSEIRKKLA